jgi:peptidoglycan-associated lipoprotein
MYSKKWIAISLILLTTTSCQTATTLSNLWENAKTGIRQATFKGKSLISKDPTSRLVSTTNEFFGSLEEDFIPLSDDDVHTLSLSQPKEVPGNPGSKVPGISQFQTPSKSLGATFSKIYFNTDQHTPKDKEQIDAIQKIAQYLKKHQNTYIFIEGHTDERAPEAYNLALGTKRSNCVRNLLIKEGVNKDQLYTVSYGKEKPEASGHNEKAWAKNRRVSFRIYEAERKK